MGRSKWDLRDNHKEMYDNAVECLIQYLRRENIQKLIIGISGGIDSMVSVAIARAAVDTVRHVRIYGRYLPIECARTTEEIAVELDRVADVGRLFCDNFKVHSMDVAFRQLMPELEHIKSDPRGPFTFDDKVRRGNVMARLRMIQLFHIAHELDGMVLSTDNLTEYYLGFWTLHGDVGNYGSIQNLWKTEVYGIAGYLIDLYRTPPVNAQEEANAIAACYDAIPTDGLGITDSDFAQIGVNSYSTADMIIIDYLSRRNLHENHPIIQRLERSEFKRRDPCNVPRHVLVGR